MINSQTTVREARQVLFNIDTPDADMMRRELFEQQDQDVALTARQLRDTRTVMVCSGLSIHQVYGK